MDKLVTLAGIAAVLPEFDIDTDMIIPAQCLRSPSFDLGQGLFLHRRFTADGIPRQDFVLNQPPFDRSEILVAGSNFGCGSSREHAVWALYRFGVRCVVATSFGEIFYENCFKNGLLPAIVSATDLERLYEELPKAGFRLEIDLSERKLVTNGKVFGFEVPTDKQMRLIEGLDEIEMTLKDIAIIKAFRDVDRGERPWIYELETYDLSA